MIHLTDANWPGFSQLSEDEQFHLECDIQELYDNWRRSVPRYSEVGWLGVFPEMRRQWAPVVRRRLKTQRMFLEAKLSDERFETGIRLRYSHDSVQDEVTKHFARERIAVIEKEIKTVDGQLLSLRVMGKPVDSIQRVRLTEDMIARAKEYPLEQLVEVNRQGFAKCIWHEEKHPSMFCKKNFAHCFTCQQSGDTIAVVMQKEGLQFKDAVMRLQA